MFVSDALCRLHIKAQEDIYNVIPISFLHHLNTGHIYYNYEHLMYTLYKHNIKQEQMNTKSKRGRHSKFANCAQTVAANTTYQLQMKNTKCN